MKEEVHRVRCDDEMDDDDELMKSLTAPDEKLTEERTWHDDEMDLALKVKGEEDVKNEQKQKG